MNIQIINKNFSRDLYGFSGKIENSNFGATGLKLMDAMWQEIDSRGLEHKGINYWVYEKEEIMFSGVELTHSQDDSSALELWEINLDHYAYWKHVGSYNKLKEVNTAMRNELTRRGIEYCYPCIEIYGHMLEDESKLETEIIWAITNSIREDVT
jgi:hypothetical protein